MKNTADLIVIGGGVIGCAIAYEARKAKAKVFLFERGTLGCEASSAAAGMLVPQAEAQEDDSFFRFCLRARGRFPAFLEELREVTGASVEWHQSGCVHVPASAEEESALSTRSRWQKAKGLRVEILSSRAARDLEPELSSEGPLFYFPDEAHLNNVEYAEVLGRAATRIGTVVRLGEEVRDLLTVGGKVIGVRTSRGEIHAPVVVNAAGAWSGRWSPSRAPVEPVRGQMISLRTETLSVRRLVYGNGCYLVPRAGGELLVGATVERVGYDKRVTAEAVERLIRAATNLVPVLREAEYRRAWAGLRPGARDGLPILGPDPDCRGLVHATGHFRNGILLSALTGSLITGAAIRGLASEIPEEFSPGRFSPERRREAQGTRPHS